MMIENMYNEQDYIYMQLAIDLAKRGRFTTTPNPNVGCVIVKDNQIIGQGYHQKPGEPHAEVYALAEAGKKAEGATVYVTLEPCSHFGRTPPCAMALIKAKISRVVIAMSDPNPKVAGKGIELLRKAGIKVTLGILKQQAELLNKGFLKRMRTGKPYVQLKLAASLDGKIAMSSGESKWITSSLARQDVQLYRAQASCILSTRATVQADDASLNVRYSELPKDIQAIYPITSIRQPIRIIIDGQNKLTGSEKIFQQSGETWLVRMQHKVLSDNQCKIIIEPSQGAQINLNNLLNDLGREEMNTVWVEAGAHLAGSLIEQGLVDELILYYAPKLLGHNALDMCIMPHLNKLAQAPKFTFQSSEMIGEDLKLTLINNEHYSQDTK